MYAIDARTGALTRERRKCTISIAEPASLLFLARHCAEVIGAELVPEAIADAKKNSKLNGISNVKFEAGDLKDLLNADFIARHGKPDVLVAIATRWHARGRGGAHP
ncbi:MAG: methyltransferase domain-containing protein [Flavobacteriales bacterium]|nr:methyltransferase domain-containing protein [Flavobacteriales bacterium]